MLKIRLRRGGKRNQPSYRIVVTEHTAPIKGSYLESLGNYDPHRKEFKVDADRVLHWLNHGAKPSERMARLLMAAGVKHKQITLPDYSKKPKRGPKKVVEAGPAPVPATVSAEDASEGAPSAPAESSPTEAEDQASSPPDTNDSAEKE